MRIKYRNSRNDKKFNNGENNNDYNNKITKIFLVILVLTSLYLIFSSPVFSIEKEKSEEQISQWIEQLRDTDWRIRDIALINIDRLPEEQKSQMVRTSLINLLEEELSGTYDNQPGEGHGEYLLFLLEAVVRLEDKKALPVLVDTLSGEVGSGYVVVEAIAKFGELAVDPVIEKLNDDKINSFGRSNAAFVLEKILEFRKEGSINITEESKKKIKESLMKTLRCNDPWTKRYAIRGIANLEDSDSIPILKSIVQNDPYSEEIDAYMRGGEKGKKIKIYPVREEAEKALTLIEKTNIEK